MKLIVTGGAGFVGSHLVKYLVKQGHDVSVIDNLARGTIENLESIKKDVQFYKIDIRDFTKLNNVLDNVDGVFHEAALTVVPESFTNRAEYYAVNVKGTENIFKLAKKFSFKVVYASSSSVYGNTTKIPINESVKRKPINPYGETKLEDEFLAERYAKLGVSVIGLRYFNIYGEGQSSSYAGVITKFIDNIMNSKPLFIYGDGNQVRDFVFVEDVAAANLLAMKSDIKFAFINIGSGYVISISELANNIMQHSGLSLKTIYTNPLEGDIKLSQADISLARKLLKWEPKTKLNDWLQTRIEKLMKIKMKTNASL